MTVYDYVVVVFYLAFMAQHGPAVYAIQQDRQRLFPRRRWNAMVGGGQQRLYDLLFGVVIHRWSSQGLRNRHFLPGAVLMQRGRPDCHLLLHGGTLPPDADHY